jgi:hypothetical protein
MYYRYGTRGLRLYTWRCTGSRIEQGPALLRCYLSLFLSIEATRKKTWWEQTPVWTRTFSEMRFLLITLRRQSPTKVLGGVVSQYVSLYFKQIATHISLGEKTIIKSLEPNSMGGFTLVSEKVDHISSMRQFHHNMHSESLFVLHDLNVVFVLF